MAEAREEDIFAETEETLEEEIPEVEPDEEAITEEGAEAGADLETAAETAAPTMIHTVEEIPQLEGLEIGDPITFTITNITEDGSYELTPEAPTTEIAPEAGIGGEEAGLAGRAAVEEALLLECRRILCGC